MDVATWRISKGLSQGDLAIQLGLQSKGRVSRLESSADRWPTDLAIKMDRLSAGDVPVAELRPDLSDVRVLRAGETVRGPFAPQTDAMPEAGA